MRQVVLVNGVPASGKSTVTADLVKHFTAHGIAAVPLSLDTVKEGLFAHLGLGDRDYNRNLGRASYRAIFETIANFPDNLVPVVDAWHGFQPLEFAEEHLKIGRVDHTIEVWCAVSPDIAAERYRRRAAVRGPGHPPASYAKELRQLAASAGPLRFGPVLELSTDKRVPPAKIDEAYKLLLSKSE